MEEDTDAKYNRMFLRIFSFIFFFFLRKVFLTGHRHRDETLHNHSEVNSGETGLDWRRSER